MTVNLGQSEICYDLTVANLDTVVAALHSAPAGINGPVVVPLDAPVSGSSSDCVTVEASLAKAIAKAPQVFYVNVHSSSREAPSAGSSAEAPGGQLRGGARASRRAASWMAPTSMVPIPTSPLHGRPLRGAA